MVLQLPWKDSYGYGIYVPIHKDEIADFYDHIRVQVVHPGADCAYGFSAGFKRPHTEGTYFKMRGICPKDDTNAQVGPLHSGKSEAAWSIICRGWLVYRSCEVLMMHLHH